MNQPVRTVISVVAWIAIAYLVLVFAAVALVWSLLALGPGASASRVILVCCVWLGVLLPLVVAGLVLRGPRESRLCRQLLLLAIMLLPAIYLAWDAASLENDYTEADLCVPDRDAEASYAVFMTYKKRGGLYFEDLPNVSTRAVVTNPLAHASNIEIAWAGIKKGREYIAKLDEFEGIADLTPLRYDAEMMSFLALRTIARTHYAYALLLAARGEAEAGVDELLRLYSVTRKALPYGRSLVHKMIWVGVAGGAIDTADTIVRNYQCEPELLEKLKVGFPPLIQRDASTRNSLLSEYLATKRLVMERGNLVDFMPIFRMSVAAAPVSPFIWRKHATIRLFKEYYDVMLNNCRNWPPDLSAVSQVSEKMLTRLPCLKNTGGQLLAGIAVPSFINAEQTAFETMVRSEILAVEIGRKLGEVPALNDPHTGKPYALDGDGAFSVGPDRKAGTEDDIRHRELYRY